MSLEHSFNRTAALDMLYLACCAAAGEQADASRVQQMDLSQLYQMSCSHSLTALVCVALEKTGAVDAAGLKPFRMARDKSVRKNLLLDVERGKLCMFLEENGIWYMPLKGVILKDLYPGMGLRQMADNDILFDSTYRSLVKGWFECQGYQTIAYGTSEQDAYEKPPVYNYEMHVALYSDLGIGRMNAYYQDVKARLVKDEGNGFGFHFTDEDFYVYFLSHGFKHYNGHGNGLRFLIDLYIFLKNKQGLAECEYVRGELAKLGLTKFEQRCRELMERIFSDIHSFDEAQLVPTQREMLEYFLSCGAYGSLEIYVSNKIEHHGRLGFILSWIFPGVKHMKYFMPAVEKHPWLLPVSWVCRAVKQVPVRYRAIVHELHVICRTKRK